MYTVQRVTNAECLFNHQMRRTGSAHQMHSDQLLASENRFVRVHALYSPHINWVIQPVQYP
jgi:hypothetical protein